MKTLNNLDPAVYAADLAKTIAAQQAKIDNLPDWWQQVVAQLHSQLDKAFPPFYDDALDAIPPWKGRPDKECPVCSEPEDKPHAPDCEYAVLDSLCLAKMAPTRMNLLESEQNGLAQRLGELESHSLAYRIETLEAFLDFDPKAPASDTLPDDIHDLIAEGMTGVTTDMHTHLERMTRRIDDLQDLLLKAVLKVNALESKAPC